MRETSGLKESKMVLSVELKRDQGYAYVRKEQYWREKIIYIIRLHYLL